MDKMFVALTQTTTEEFLALSHRQTLGKGQTSGLRNEYGPGPPSIRLGTAQAQRPQLIYPKQQQIE